MSCGEYGDKPDLTILLVQSYTLPGEVCKLLHAQEALFSMKQSVLRLCLVLLLLTRL